jgi:hypothetical protein
MMARAGAQPRVMWASVLILPYDVEGGMDGPGAGRPPGCP